MIGEARSFSSPGLSSCTFNEPRTGWKTLDWFVTGTFLLPDWGGCSLVMSSRPTFTAKNVDSQLKVRSQERNNKLKTDGNMYYKFNRAACSENCKGDIMLNLFIWKKLY